MVIDKQDWDDLSNYRDSLEHYGVLGMKWGVRKDRSSSGQSKTTKHGSSTKSSKEKKKTEKEKAKAEKEAAKQQKRRREILSSPTKLYKHRKEFTYEEIQNAMKTFEWEKKLNEYSKQDLQRGANTIKMMVEYANNAVNLYNIAARIANSVSEKDGQNVLPYIGGGDPSKNRKKGSKSSKEAKD